MSDSSEPQGPSLPEKLGVWVSTAYGYCKWPVDFVIAKASSSTGGTAEQAPPVVPTESAAVKMLARLNPRPAKTVAPAAATNLEKQAIDDAFDRLVDHLNQNKDSEDLSNAKLMFVTVVKLVDDTTKAISDRQAVALKRTELVTRLGKVPLPSGVTADEAKTFAKSRTDRAKEITAATTLDDISAVELKIKTFEDEVQAALAMVQPRSDALIQITGAKATHKALGKIVDRGYYIALDKAINAAETALAKATKLTEIDTLRKDLQDVLDIEAAARTYAAFYDNWSVQSEIYLSLYAPDPDAHKRRDARNTAADAAAKKAEAFDFKAAKAELAKFDNDPNVAGGDFTASAAFGKKLMDFEASHKDKLNVIKGCKMPGSNVMDTDYATARKKGIVDKNWVAGTTLMDALITKINGLYPIALHWREINPLVSGATPATDPLKVAILAVKSEISNAGLGDYAVGLAAFTGLDAAVKNGVAAKNRLSGLRKRADAAVIAGRAAAYAHVDGLLTFAEADIPGDLPKAETGMTTAETALKAIEAWMTVMAEADVAKGIHDATDEYKLLKPAADEAIKHNYVNAKQAAELALAGYQALADYRATRAQITLLRTAHDPSTDAYKLIGTALTEAEDLAMKQLKPAEAHARLLEVLAQPDLAEAGHEAGLWIAKIDAVKKLHRKIAPTVEPSSARKTVVDSLIAAEEKANKDHDYPAAVALLNGHEAMLKTAREYVALRKRTQSVKAALDRAVAEFSADPTAMTKIYGGADDKALVKSMTDAEALATAGKVEDAGKAFKKLLEDWKPLIKATAKLHEAADHVGSNAGHSLKRHGSDVSDDKLLRRLLTGIAADDKPSSTKASSKFSNMEAWLQAREEGAAFASKKQHPDGSFVDLTAKTIPVDINAVHNIPHEIDHGDAIDEAYISVRQAQGVDVKKGKVGDGDTSETYEKISGITKSTTLWLFEIDFAAITIPPVGHVAPPPFSLKKSPETYIDLYTSEHGGAPASIPGKWVMMQLFPKVAGWNQELQDYDR